MNLVIPTKIDVIRTDQSALKCAKECQLQWYFRYVLNLQKKGSPSPKSPLVYGSIAHTGMESLYTKKNWLNLKKAHKAAKREWLKYYNQDEFQEENNLDWYKLLYEVTECITRYYNHYVEWDQEHLEPIMQEVPFEIALTEEVLFYGKFDGVIRNKETGLINLKEYKFYRVLVPGDLDEVLQFDFQTTVYSMAARITFGDQFDRILYRVQRKEAPKSDIPDFYQNEVTRTTKECEKAATIVVAHALQLKWAINQGWFMLVPALDSDYRKYENTCMKCEFKNDLCKAFISGEDWPAVANLNYVNRQEYADLEEESK